MKKLAGIIMCILVVCVAYVAEGFLDYDSNRYIQHESDSAYTGCAECDRKELCTNLPIVKIDTDEAIPGKAYRDPYTNLKKFEKSKDGKDEIEGRIRIIDNGNANNHESDEASEKSRMMIHVRGNSSRYFDKSGYALKLIDKDGKKNDVAVMGMKAHHDWALHGPFLDKTLMRNYLWYNVAGQIMDYAPNVRFCEVFVNGEYKGVYVMEETITAGEDGARLNLSVDESNQTYSGYVLRLDRGADTQIKNIEPFSRYTYRTKQKLNIVYPGTGSLTPKIAESIEQDFSDFEKALYSYDYDDEKHGYKSLIDVESFVDFFIINEFTQNYDAGWLSTYIYKDNDGRYRMCIWDFNSADDCYVHKVKIDEFEMHEAVWFNMLIKDEDFVEAVIARYRELRNGVLSEDNLYSNIDAIQTYLGGAIDRNYDVWGYSFNEEKDYLKPASRNPRNYSHAIKFMKAHIHKRGIWLDENIESLRQYSAESKVKKFNANAN